VSGFVSNARGDALTNLGRYSEAIVETRRYLDFMQKLVPPTSAALAAPLESLGEEQVGLGQATEAIKTLQRTLALYQASDARPDQLADARLTLARALWLAGKHEQARVEGKLAADAFTEVASALGGRFVKRRDEANAWLATHQLR
jgi:tetratricopeptide (TPR) repeat protein